MNLFKYLLLKIDIRNRHFLYLIIILPIIFSIVFSVRQPEEFEYTQDVQLAKILHYDLKNSQYSLIIYPNTNLLTNEFKKEITKKINSQSCFVKNNEFIKIKNPILGLIEIRVKQNEFNTSDNCLQLIFNIINHVHSKYIYEYHKYDTSLTDKLRIHSINNYQSSFIGKINIRSTKPINLIKILSVGFLLSITIFILFKFIKII